MNAHAPQESDLDVFTVERDADVLNEQILAFKEAVVLLAIALLLVLRELWCP
ncbi:MAG: hypothetical protein OEW19_08985 [Acidobacteriota bacterium]|nr:hypothetical protein [Acidobacteriota bacterium]